MLDQTNHETKSDFELPQTQTQKLYAKRSAHFLTTGKGGCGKSLIAGFLAQYYMELGAPVTCIDADPINNTLAGVRAFNAQIVELLRDESINVPAMDELFSVIVDDDCNYIIDPGAVGYVPLLTYMLREGLFEMLADSGKQVMAHAIVFSGESMAETMAGVCDLIEQLPECVDITLWLNPYLKPLEFNGVAFEETAFWQNRRRIHGVVRLQTLNSVTTLPTFRKLIDARMTFAEATRSDTFNAAEKLRLARIWTQIREQIGAL